MATYPDSQVTYATNTSAPPWETDQTAAAGISGQYDVSNTTAAHYYIPQLFAKKVLMNFYASSVFEQITNTD